MKATEFKKAREKLKLGSQVETAKFLGLARRTVQKYEDSAPIPLTTAMLLRIMLRYRMKPDIVSSEFGD